MTCRFAHLVNYGGSYYSYAYAMCLASSVWEKLFQADPLNRQAGGQNLVVDSYGALWDCISERCVYASISLS